MPKLPYIEKGSGNRAADEYFESIPERPHGSPYWEKEWVRSPEFLRRFLHAMGFFQPEQGTLLSPRIQELQHLAAMERYKCLYGFTVHTPIGLRAGLTLDQIKEIHAYEESAAFSDADKAVLRHTEELLRDGRVSDETFREVVSVLGEDACFELAAATAISSARSILAGWSELDLDPWVVDELTAEDPELLPQLRAHFDR